MKVLYVNSIISFHSLCSRGFFLVLFFNLLVLAVSSGKVGMKAFWLLLCPLGLNMARARSCIPGIPQNLLGCSASFESAQKAALAHSVPGSICL